MKKKNPFSALSIDELEAKKKMLRGIVFGLGFVMITAFCILIYLALTQEKSLYLIAIAFGCALTFLPTLINFSLLNSEIKSRFPKHSHEASPNCLNCTATVSLHFCPNCGQKSTTHRYSIKHFVEHDFVHGVWHVDKGIFFTVKELFTRPGHSVREFIQGKRVIYFSFITLILMLLTLGGLLAPYTQIKMVDLMPQESKEMMGTMERFMSTYPKLVMIITIPFYSLFSFLWFRKSRLNFSEHLVLNSYRIIPELIIGLLITVICIFYTNTKVLSFLYIGIVGMFGLFYSVWFYYQFFSAYYANKKLLLLRSIGVPASYMFLSFLVGIIIGAVGLLKG